MNIEFDEIERFRSEFLRSSKNIMAMNAVSNNPLESVALSREFVSKYDRTFSIELKTNGITNQQKSGRCWMFAGTNLLREIAAEKLDLDFFELSQSYLTFWDKFEKANYFLESIIKTLDEDLHGRLVSWLLGRLAEDGGQWGMFSNLVEKYGVVPKDVMRESYHTSNSRETIKLLRSKLREDAMVLRNMRGKDLSDLESKKDEMLGEVFRILAINYGLPPKEFSYSYKDRAGSFHRIDSITPKGFYEGYVGLGLEDMVAVINAPTDDKDYGKLYTVEYLGNVVGGKDIAYLNTDMDTMKDLTVRSMKDGNLVWFSVDSGKMIGRESGIYDNDLYDYEAIYDVGFDLSKAQRLDYGESLMTHAMVLSGVDLRNSKPLKWKVENSWGDKNGDNGYFVMGDSWFDEYVYEVVIDRKYLPENLKKALEEKPIVLKPWDPMGSVAFVK